RPKCEFRKDDRLFILWGEYDDAYISLIKSIHNLRGVKLLQISYDLLPLVAPQYSGHSTEGMKKYNKEIFPLCDLIFSISESTKRDIQVWLRENNLDEPKIEVFRLGDDFKLSKPTKPSLDKF